MDILEFLTQHLLVLDHLGMAALLPQLIFTIDLVTCLVIPELIQNRAIALLTG